MKRMLAQRTGLLERLPPIGVTGVTYRRPLRQDHAIDYNEFMQLFPVRVQRMRELKDLQA